MSAGNQYEWLRMLDKGKKTVIATCTLKVGTDDNLFMVDNPVIVADPAADVTITVPDGVKAGQQVFIANKTNSGAKTLTLSVSKHYTSSPETFTISTEGQCLLLMWDGERWSTMGGNATAT